MFHNTIPIQAKGSETEAKLVTYFLDHSSEMLIDKRPVVLICPGGGYEYTSEREGEVLATQFLAMGYHAAVLYYSCAPARFPVALTELANAVKLLRTRADEWFIDPNAVIVLGSSAGGHLAAFMGILWEEDFLAEAVGIREKDRGILRPDGMILCYPVITSGEYAHRGSFECLLGKEEGSLERWYDKNSLLAQLSLESRVTSKTSPAFIWHTFTDGSVPVENSLMMVNALHKAGVPTEFHMYPVGGHGLSLANRLTQHRDGSALQEECTSWIPLVHTWLESQFVK